MGGFASTPLFELFRRALTTQAIQKFRGINAYSTLAQLGPEWAQDLLNVIVSGSGGLSKLRLPIKLSPTIPTQNSGPNSFWDFQQGNGTRQVLAQFGASMYYFINDLGNANLIETNAQNGGQWSFVAANQILFGVNNTRAMKWTGTAWQNWGGVAPIAAPAAPGVIAGNLSPATGYLYGYAYKNSVTGHCTNISLSSPSTGAQANKQFTVVALIPPDAQFDTIVWFRVLDGGGDLYRLAEVNFSSVAGVNTSTVTFNAATVSITAGTNALGITDNTPDNKLDQTILGPLINNPPIVGKYVASGQNRVFIFNLQGAPQDFIYSGYEQIFFGRPEESFPPNNRIRLSIGADQLAGGGILQAGVVAFSQTGRMFMLRGALEDITLNVPINFSAYLEELPWTLGCASHFTIQTTPYGLVWLAGDKTVQLFDGHSEPIDISTAVYPLLQRITPGTENQCTSGYFNWLERDLYVLSCAVDGSLTANRLFIWAFNKAPGSDQIETVEVFISDIPTQIGGLNWIGLVTTSKLQRMLCVASGGFIQQLPVSSDTVGGITQDFTITPATAGTLNAYWRSGYFGNESPYRSKLFRWLRLLSDQDATPYQATLRYVDDEAKTFRTPEIQGPYKFSSSKMSMNRRAKKASVEINFPSQDVSANVLELQVASIPTSDR